MPWDARGGLARRSGRAYGIDLLALSTSLNQPATVTTSFGPHWMYCNGSVLFLNFTLSEDVVFTTENLLRYDGIMFFITGEPPLNESQRRAFCGFHSSVRGPPAAHSSERTNLECFYAARDA
jgi:hypothetical protein